MNQTTFLKNQKIGNEFSFIGKLNSINKGEHFINVDLLLEEKFCINIKLDLNSELPQKEKIYIFEAKYITTEKEKNILFGSKYNLIEDMLEWDNIYYYYNLFFSSAPISFQKIDETINEYLSQIKNPTLYQLTNNLYQKNKKKFLISPAAFKMHHNYYGGLGYHTYNMLRMASNVTTIYPFLNKDLLNCGIILHDMAKIKEFDFISKNYNKEGVLLGHLVLGVNDIQEEAILLGIQNTEEILLLKHLLIAHHGLLEYGSPKEPKIGEALILWYLDNIDAKLNTLGEYLQKTKKGEFTENISVIEGKKFYNPDL
ncbi:HD domain-containing protein ['Camptotheca acuminata' phytoplasma]|uniref:HD domain-containing protein n=1 Tax='Camptotheca acuminata' phytoplasma TaxID=3239192 RepID=UPI00351AB040